MLRPRGDSRSKAVSDATAQRSSALSLVQQHYKDEVDVNTIMRRFGVTGAMPFGQAAGVYGDFTGILDYEDAVEKVRDARERFMALPAEVRERFNNDPGVMISAAQEMSQDEFEALYTPIEPNSTPDTG